MGDLTAILIFVATGAAFFLAIGLTERAIQRVLEQRRWRRFDKTLKNNEKKKPK